MSTTPLTSLRNLLSALLPSSSTTFTLPVLPTPDAVEFHLSPPGSPVQLSGTKGIGSGRRREGGRAVGRDEGSAPSTADLLAPNAGGTLRTAQLDGASKKAPRRVVLSSRAGGESSAWKACGVEERRRCRA